VSRHYDGTLAYNILLISRCIWYKDREIKEENKRKRSRYIKIYKKTKTPWLESAIELYRPTERPPLVGEVSANFRG
jgi:hypothetical protein